MATIETDLKEILGKLDQRFDRLEQRLERMEGDLTTIKVSQARIEEKLDSLDLRVSHLEGSQNKQIWALIVAIIGAMTAAVIKFGFFPNP
jgi:chaperonin cofactor prefoldin